MYLADDLHRKQMTINLRDEAGEVLLRRQVSTWGDEPHKFLAEMQRRSRTNTGARKKRVKLQNVAQRADHRLTPRTLSGMSGNVD